MRTLVAILAMSSSAIFAQTHSPAQPASTPTLQASLYRPASLSTITTTPTAAAATTVAEHASTGVTAPKLLQAAQFTEDHNDFLKLRPQMRTVVLDLKIDEKGKISDVKVLSSNDPLANPGVVRAVSQFQYQPASLDGVAVPVHVKLTYNIAPHVQD